MVGGDEGGALLGQVELVQVGVEAVHLADAGQLPERHVGDDRLAGTGAVAHVALPPGEHGPAPELLVLQVERWLGGGQEPAQVPVPIEDHEAPLARAATANALGDNSTWLLAALPNRDDGADSTVLTRGGCKSGRV